MARQRLAPSMPGLSSRWPRPRARAGTPVASQRTAFMAPARAGAPCTTSGAACPASSAPVTDDGQRDRPPQPPQHRPVIHDGTAPCGTPDLARVICPDRCHASSSSADEPDVLGRSRRTMSDVALTPSPAPHAHRDPQRRAALGRRSTPFHVKHRSFPDAVSPWRDSGCSPPVMSEPTLSEALHRVLTTASGPRRAGADLSSASSSPGRRRFTWNHPTSEPLGLPFLRLHATSRPISARAPATG